MADLSVEEIKNTEIELAKARKTHAEAAALVVAGDEAKAFAAVLTTALAEIDEGNPAYSGLRMLSDTLNNAPQTVGYAIVQLDARISGNPSNAPGPRF